MSNVALFIGLYYAEFYARAGYPHGRTARGMLLWMEHRCQARAN